MKSKYMFVMSIVFFLGCGISKEEHRREIGEVEDQLGGELEDNERLLEEANYKISNLENDLEIYKSEYYVVLDKLERFEALKKKELERPQISEEQAKNYIYNHFDNYKTNVEMKNLRLMRIEPNVFDFTYEECNMMVPSLFDDQEEKCMSWSKKSRTLTVFKDGKYDVNLNVVF